MCGRRVMGKRRFLRFVSLLTLAPAWHYGTPQTAAAHPASPPPLTVGQRLAQDLQWTQAEREDRFARMDQMFPVNRIRHGGCIAALPKAMPLTIAVGGQELAAFMQRDRLAGMLVLQDGRIRLERYGLRSNRATHWTSFSMTKAVTSTLVGVALRDHAIHSLQDAVTQYMPEMQGSAYTDVTVRQLLTMTSGVHWVEDYDAPDSDNVRLYSTPVQPGKDTVIEYMRKLPRESAPGTRWVYKTGETDLTGALVRRATGMTLSSLLERNIWRNCGGPGGMESDAYWIAEDGKEYGGSGISATLRDWGRFGELIRKGAPGVVAPGWVADATRTHEALATPGRGYGYQWWTFADGSYAALGIFGQSMWIDPARKLVVVTLGAWPKATSPALAADRQALWDAVRAAIDARK